MAYFKILPILRDKYVDMGMLNISAELYLEQGDEGYDKYIAEHFVTVPIIPEGGYTGKFNKDGVPVNQTDYDNWIKSLPTVWRLNPFCTHSIQFEHDVTEEEILWCFEFALGITHRNYLGDDLYCQKGGQIVNQPFYYSERREYYKVISQLPLRNRSDYMNNELAKVTKAENKLNKIKNTEFTKVETIGKYKVK
jgi:hypothetical protein